MIVLVVIALVGAGALGVVAYRQKQAREAAEAELNRLAHHDRLTGLPNRSVLVPWLDECLAMCRRRSARVATVLIDLDKFKLINDSYGPEVGDGLMKAVVARLKTVMRPGDKLVRSAGTQFVVICPDIPDTTAAEQLCSRIMSAIQTPFEVGQDLIRMNACIGVTVTNEHSSDVDGVLLDAEVALHKAKDDGPGTIAMFEQSMHSRLTPANAERRLREALERGEFQLLYMPIISLDTYRMTGVEALIRWKDPERGMISPGEFIPAMEESGLIVSVGAWVLQEACRQARHWHENFPGQEPLEVTVNISARQLAQSDFLDVLNQAVAVGGGAAAHLCLEVTEGALKYDLDAAWAMLRHSKQLGVSLALDDFGTGSSSIKSVRTFKCDVLKIDKAFIDGLGMAAEDTAIVQHIISLANDLGMIAVAEGVETAEQVAELRRLNCHRAQGYYFGHPVPPGMIDDMLYDSNVVKTAPPPSEPLPQRGPGAPEVLMAGADIAAPPADPALAIPTHSPAAFPEGAPARRPAPPAPAAPAAPSAPAAPAAPATPAPAAPAAPAADAPIQRDAPRPHEPQPLMAPRKTAKADPVVVPVPPRPGGPRRRSELAG